ncbi:MAG: hypothetical protein OHK0015_23130 [Chloroflexi bacterium OHK40]
MVFDTPIHTNEQSIERVLQAGLPVLLVFWRKACPPCEQLTPTLERLAAAYAGKALIARIDAQDNPVLLRRYGVTRLPALVFAKDRAVVAQAVGAAPEGALRAWLDYLVSGGARPALPQGPSVPLESSPPPAPQPPPQSPPQRPAERAARPRETTSTTPIVLTDATFDQIVGGDTPVLVDFWAPWCGPCRMVAPTVDRLAQEFAGRAVVAKLNVDENPRTAQRFGISSIPALFVFRRGQVIERLFGAQPAPVLRQALAKHVAA